MICTFIFIFYLINLSLLNDLFFIIFWLFDCIRDELRIISQILNLRRKTDTLCLVILFFSCFRAEGVGARVQNIIWIGDDWADYAFRGLFFDIWTSFVGIYFV